MANMIQGLTFQVITPKLAYSKDVEKKKVPQLNQTASATYYLSVFLPIFFSSTYFVNI